MENYVVLGATGSIGTSTLDVISRNPDLYSVYALVANSSHEKMLQLCAQHQPQFAHMVDSQAAKALQDSLPKDCVTQVTTGEAALSAIMTDTHVDTVMAAIVGAAGLVPTFDAVKAGKKILLANKEALVMSGQLFMDTAKQSGATILPVDSEHNAIFQSMPENVQSALGFCDLEQEGINHVLLTGSGGPFLTAPLSSLSQMTPQQACKHPNWSMGRKISVDSATMMNKGLEYIEAKWLFNTSPSQLKVVIHPQSVIHSMVQYNDGSVIAELGNPDMRTPIAHCMSYPKRIPSGVEPLDFFKVGQLTFCEPDFERFPCLKLAIQACEQGQEATTVLNAANEIAVEAFLNEQIAFTDIAKVNSACLEQVKPNPLSTIDAILALDEQARQLAQDFIATAL
ncbi:1-deoxy-D-xylulose-5-phosphate reductoisomerase [Shewanella maritima]|uniref:1-deoxy-D-xylulose-5-phosphate reductoisomerase n=1 Tax=Shewanella maritima TaxID=2520507 RepID=UPI003735D5B4